MGVKQFVVLAGCSTFFGCATQRPLASGDDVLCGPGTEEINHVCLPVIVDGGRPDAAPRDAAPTDGSKSDGRRSEDAPRDARLPDAPPDAPPDAAIPDAPVVEDEATNFAIDSAHDNTQSIDTIASPLAPLWSATFTGQVVYPLVVGGLVIVSAAESQADVRALDINTGARVWGPIVFGDVVTLAADRGRIFALDENGHLTALDATTGLHIWSIQVQGQSFYWSPPVAAGGIVYVNGLGEGGTTVAISEQDGSVLWGRSTFDGSDGCVAVAAGVVYEAEACDQLSAWDALTGTPEWSHSGNCTGGGGAAPAVYDGMVWQRDWAEGNVIYNHAGMPVGTFAGDTIPAFHAGTVFYQSSSTVTAVDIASDTLLWSFAGDGKLCTSPVVAGAGHQVFVGSSLGNVYELDEITGAERSVHNVGASVTCFSEAASMAVAEGHLLVPVGDTLVVY